MKILRIVSAGYEQGGAENGIVLTNKLLKANGHEVIVLSSDVNPSVAHFSNYEFKSVATKGIHKLTSAAFNYSAYQATKRLLRDFQPDVVLLHTLSQPTASVIYPLRHTPTIMFVHGPELYTKALLPWYLKKDDYKNGTFKIADLTTRGRLHYLYFLYVCRPLYLAVMSYINKVVALSSYTQSMLANEHISADLIPNGVGLNSAAPYRPSVRHILYAGRIEKFKGIDDLITAMPDIHKQYPDTVLTIAGEGAYRANLENLVGTLGLQSTVRFVGKLAPNALKQAYIDCSVFVLPSTWPETFGKVGVEAMSIGRPVIATDVGGVTDWLEDGKNGFLIKPHQPAQIAEKARALFSDEAVATQMANYAAQSAQRFSIEAMTQNIEAMINELAKSTKGPNHD